MSLCVFTFVPCPFLLQNVFLKFPGWNSSTFLLSLPFSVTLSVFSFCNSIPTEKSQTISLLSRKIFCERKMSCTRLDFGERAVSLHLARSRNLPYNEWGYSCIGVITVLYISRDVIFKCFNCYLCWILFECCFNLILGTSDRQSKGKEVYIFSLNFEP